MKKMDFLCTSRASTAVCSSQSRRSTSGLGHHHRLDDGRKRQLHIPCLSQLPINPKPQFEKHRKSSYSTTSKQSDDHIHHNLRRKSCADVDDLKSSLPGSSARYLLADSSSFIDWFSESSTEGFLPLIPAAQPEERETITSNDYRAPKSASLARSMTVHEYRGLKSPSSSLSRSSQHQSPALRTSSSARSRDQVVVLKVSLHCKGCEEKVKKHLSKMEGVTSFSVDFTTKKVTIIGDVTPLGAVASVSKVKHAQLWPSPSPSPSSSSSFSSSTSQSSLLSF